MKCFVAVVSLCSVAIFFTIPNHTLADQGNGLQIGQYRGINNHQNSVFWKQLHDLTSLLTTSDLLTNIRDIRLDGVTTSVSGNVITVHNLRVLSDTTDLDDYLSLSFLLNLESLSFIPAALEITEDLGVFSGGVLFSKDTQKDIVMMTMGGNLLASDQLHFITVGPNDEFTMSLEAGTVLAYHHRNASDDFELQIDGPDGTPYERSLYRANITWTGWGRVILQPGVYTLRFVPQNNTMMTLRFGVTNNNRTPLRDVVSGDRITVSLRGWGNEYAKYRLQLDAGDLLDVTDPSDNDIQMVVLNSNGLGIANVISGAIFAKVAAADTYYLFVINRDFNNSSGYSGTITITPDANRSLYPVLQPVPQQFANNGQAFTLQLSASNTPIHYRSTGLPPTISLDETTGLISGTPTISGTFLIRVSVENEFGSDQTNFLLTIQ